MVCVPSIIIFYISVIINNRYHIIQSFYHLPFLTPPIPVHPSSLPTRCLPLCIILPPSLLNPSSPVSPPHPILLHLSRGSKLTMVDDQKGWL